MSVTALFIARYAEEHNPFNVHKDMTYLSEMVSPGDRLINRMIKVAAFMMKEQIWHDVHRARPNGQEVDSERTFYLDCENHVRRVLKPEDYLKTFKEYEQQWAARKNEGSDLANWFKMQEELAALIAGRI